MFRFADTGKSERGFFGCIRSVMRDMIALRERKFAVDIQKFMLICAGGGVVVVVVVAIDCCAEERTRTEAQIDYS